MKCSIAAVIFTTGSAVMSGLRNKMDVWNYGAGGAALGTYASFNSHKGRTVNVLVSKIALYSIVGKLLTPFLLRSLTAYLSHSLTTCLPPYLHPSLLSSLFPTLPRSHPTLPAYLLPSYLPNLTSLKTFPPPSSSSYPHTHLPSLPLTLLPSSYPTLCRRARLHGWRPCQRCPGHYPDSNKPLPANGKETIRN